MKDNIRLQKEIATLIKKTNNMNMTNKKQEHVSCMDNNVVTYSWAHPFISVWSLLGLLLRNLVPLITTLKGIVILAGAILMVLSPQSAYFLQNEGQPLSLGSLDPKGNVTTKGRIGSSTTTKGKPGLLPSSI